MRIAWVGPFAAGSADARYCFLTVRAMQDLGHKVVVFRTDPRPGSEPQPFAGEIASCDTLVARTDFDIVFYALNDNYGSYGPVYPLLVARPGIVIFLSWFVYHYFRGFMLATDRCDEVSGIIDDLYGPGAMIDEVELLKGPMNDFLRAIDDAHPMGEWVARQALGGVTHSGFYLEKLRSACSGPVMMAPLAYRSDPLPSARDKRPRPDGRSILLTLGVMNANKRIESVIRALGATQRLRDAFAYRCVGGIAEPQKQQWLDLAAAFGVDVSFAGHVEEEDMRQALADADVIACLRDPPLEGGSGSVLESMLSGRPVVVTRNGCYLDIPDGVVLKVDPEREQETLAAHLAHLLDHPEERHAMGERAQAWVRRTHAPEAYAQALTAFARTVIGLHDRAKAA